MKLHVWFQKAYWITYSFGVEQLQENCVETSNFGETKGDVGLFWFVVVFFSQLE